MVLPYQIYLLNYPFVLSIHHKSLFHTSLSPSFVYYIVIFTSFPQKKTPLPSRSVIHLLYQITLNIFCDIGFSFFCSTSACAFLNSSIHFSSSSASANPICVYTFIVTDISGCPMRYYSVFGFIPDFAIFEQYVCRHT